MAPQPFPAFILWDGLEAAADRILANDLMPSNSGGTPSFRSAVMWA